MGSAYTGQRRSTRSGELLGRTFSHGQVLCRRVGSGEIQLPPIADPLAFHKALQEAQLEIRR